jgi:hypothetical protein
MLLKATRQKERIVRLGNKYGEEMEITEGVGEGEKVVVAGQQGLSEGAKVRFQDMQKQTAGTQRKEMPGKVKRANQ